MNILLIIFVYWVIGLLFVTFVKGFSLRRNFETAYGGYDVTKIILFSILLLFWPLAIFNGEGRRKY